MASDRDQLNEMTGLLYRSAMRLQGHATATRITRNGDRPIAPFIQSKVIGPARRNTDDGGYFVDTAPPLLRDEPFRGQ
jgi:hypothetical protein